MQPKVSIILPIYNVEKYLDKCLETVTGQTLRDIEIICVIDASPDNSLEICKRWKEKDDRIIIVDKKQNEGLGLTRNSGIDVAKGEFIAFVDSDDYIDVQMYEKLYSFAKENNLDAAFCNYVRDTDGIISKSNEPREQVLYKDKKETEEFLLDMIGPLPSYPSDVKYLVSVWRAIYSNKIIEDNQFRFMSERVVVSEDTIWNIDFLSKVNKVGYLPFEGYYYRFNQDSLSRTYTHEKYERFKILLAEMKNRLDKIYDYNVYSIHFFRFVFFLYRSVIKYETIRNINNNRVTTIKSRCCEPLLTKMYYEYPYLKLPISKSIFFFCMKHNFIYPLIWISIIDNRLRKVI